MAKADDYSLPESSRDRVRVEAEKLLQHADAVGQFPTPIASLMETANVSVDPSGLYDVSVIEKLRRSAKDGTSLLKRAFEKVMGVLHVRARIVYLDPKLHPSKQTFIKLHETGHAVLPWQRDIYSITEDCEKTLAPEIAEEFEREASLFASDVLFQLDSFSNEANQYDFNIKVPIDLSKKYGSSLYMAIRRYVTGSQRSCVVLVLDPPLPCEKFVFTAQLRRHVSSDKFRGQFGTMHWPNQITAFDRLGAVVPVNGRRMSSPQEITLVDSYGVSHNCLAEGFTQTHQVFILIQAA